MKVLFYTKENCLLCEEAYMLLELFEKDYALDIEVRDIYSDDAWLEKYQILIPVIETKETTLTAGEINLQSLEAALQRHSS
ncbi:MAG TPA: glutaredoxin family protein [Pseudogracilibacillus sp.]|nr:glutaredoxin family protein [Pseudogracilibacillus sp.]